jgi:hypothetical protein
MGNLVTVGDYTWEFWSRVNTIYLRMKNYVKNWNTFLAIYVLRFPEFMDCLAYRRLSSNYKGKFKTVQMLN